MPGPSPAETEPRAPATAEKTDTAAVIASGEKAKARDILAAIKTLQQVEREGRPATTEERSRLARFGGFGAVARSLFPDPVTGRYPDVTWQALGDELKSLLSPEEYDSAKRTVFSQFFTAPVVMQAMHRALRRLGVPDHALVLEPGCGVGRFMTGPHRYIGVELDGISARIARLLHPEADIRIENFRDTKLPPLDAVIGNVPFARIPLNFHGQRLSLHDFFIVKSLGALRPGGVLAVVTSHYTLDKQNAAARELIAEQADFLGTIRLPSDAFKREGTPVVTDIVFLRKRAPGQPARHAAEWLTTGTFALEGATVPVNEYFLRHPDQVLGTFSDEDTLHPGSFSVRSHGDLAEQLRTAIQRLPEIEPADPERTRPPPAPAAPAFVPPPPERHIAEGSFFIADDQVIHQVEGGQGRPVTYCGVLLKADGTPQGRKIGALIRIKESARRVLQSQNEGWPGPAREDARRAEDVGGQELSYAEVKAIASGNPAVLALAEADAELARLSALKRNHEDEQYLARRSVRDLPATIARLERRRADLSADLATLAAHAGDPLIIGDRACDRDDVLAALGRRLEALPEHVRETARAPLGRHRGLEFGVVLHPGGAAEAYLQGRAVRHGMLSREHRGPRAVLNALERLAGGYAGRRDDAARDLEIARGQLRDHEARLGQPFAHAAYLAELASLRDGLKAGLARAAPDPGAPSVLELAERAKALKAAHTIDAAPERAAPRRVSAEEPVPARIRRRLGPAPEPAVPDAEAEADSPSSPDGPPTPEAAPRVPRAVPDFRERTARERRLQDGQVRLF